MALHPKGIRVGFLSPCNPHDPTGFSGVAHSAWKALESVGLDLVDLGGRTFRNANNEFSHQTGDPVSSLGRLKNRLRKNWGLFEQRVQSPWDYSRVTNHARRVSEKTQAAVDAEEVDVLFSVCVNTMLYGLETDVPIVYASDTTANLINQSYTKFANRSAAYHRACEEIDRAALQKCSIFAPSSLCTAADATDHYGIDLGQVRVVEMGANVVPNGVPINPDAPAKDRIELVLVAADPIRKRLNLCMDVATELDKRGWNVTLNYVGPKVREAVEHPLVNWAGRLQLDDPLDRKKHMEILQRSHWMLLPSLAEAFGIAPCEAAHFGRPSVVTDVGGLGTVIKDGETGAVLPLDAPATAYADAIERYSANDATYLAMCDAALCRARTTLNWDSWGSRMHQILIEVVEGGKSCPHQK
jgi:hypothetical protein